MSGDALDPAAVEAAARVLYAQNWKRPTWDECIGEIEHDKYRAKVGALLIAAKEASK